jgi:hypothetical protein
MSFITYTFRQIIRIINSRRMRWTGNAVRIGEYVGFWWKRERERARTRETTRKTKTWVGGY